MNSHPGLSDAVYLDYNATTPVDPQVITALQPYLAAEFGNPSSSHRFAAAPARLGVADRVLRLGYFTSQPACRRLLTAMGGRIDLLVVAPDTSRRIAEAAMRVAAATNNLVPAQHILPAAGTADPKGARPSARRRMGNLRRPPAATPAVAAGRAPGAYWS
jgi:hypothetical protein